MPTPPITAAQYEAAMDALGLDPATTLSVNLSRDWVRIVHTNAVVTSEAIAADAD